MALGRAMPEWPCPHGLCPHPGSCCWPGSLLRQGPEPGLLSLRPAAPPGALWGEDLLESEGCGEGGTLCVPRVGPVS